MQQDLLSTCGIHLTANIIVSRNLHDKFDPKAALAQHKLCPGFEVNTYFIHNIAEQIKILSSCSITIYVDFRLG